MNFKYKIFIPNGFFDGFYLQGIKDNMKFFNYLKIEFSSGSSHITKGWVHLWGNTENTPQIINTINHEVLHIILSKYINTLKYNKGTEEIIHKLTNINIKLHNKMADFMKRVCGSHKRFIYDIMGVFKIG